MSYDRRDRGGYGRDRDRRYHNDRYDGGRRDDRYDRDRRDDGGRRRGYDDRDRNRRYNDRRDDHYDRDRRDDRYDRDRRGDRYDRDRRRDDRYDRDRRRDDRYDRDRRRDDGGRRRGYRREEERREIGLVVSLKKEFGFIKTPEDGDIFFHYSELRSCREDEIQIGDEVEYTPSTNRRSGDKLRASNVKIKRTKQQRREDMLKDAVLERGIVSSVNFRNRTGLIDRVESSSESRLISFSFSDLTDMTTEDSDEEESHDNRRRSNKTTREGASVEYHVVKDGYDEIALNVKILPEGTVTLEDELPVRVIARITKPYKRGIEMESSPRRSGGRGMSRRRRKHLEPNGAIQVSLFVVEQHGWKVSESQVVKPDIESLSALSVDVESWADDSVEGEEENDMSSMIEIPILAKDLDLFVLNEVSTLREGDLVEASLMIHKQTHKIRAERLCLKEFTSSRTREYGVVVKIVREKGFGFIRAVKEKEDVYFHLSEIVPSLNDDDIDLEEEEVEEEAKIRERDEVSFDLEEGRSSGNKKAASRILVVPSGTVKFEEIVQQDVEGVVEKEIPSRGGGKGRIVIDEKTLKENEDQKDEEKIPNKVTFSSRDLGRVAIRFRDRVQFDLARVLRDGKFIAMNVRLLKRAPAFETMKIRMVGEVTRNIITQRVEKRRSSKRNSNSKQNNSTCGHLKLLGPRRIESSEEEKTRSKKRVMFLCNHNSCRSHMAEGWLKHLCKDDSVEVASAGIECGTKIQEDAKIVMKEVDVDLSDHKSKSMKDFDPNDFDIVISMCGCGVKLDGDDVKAWKQQDVFEDWNLDDPPKLDTGDLTVYRRVRDECKGKVQDLLQSIYSSLLEDLHEKSQDVKHPSSGKSLLGHIFTFSSSKKGDDSSEKDAEDTLLTDLRLGDLVEFTARAHLMKKQKHEAIECKLLRRAPKKIGKVVSLKSAFGFIRMKGKKKKSEELYFDLTELHDMDEKDPVRVGDTVRFSEIKVASRKGFVNRAVEVYIEERSPKKESEARPESKRLNLKLRNKNSGRVGFNSATRQAKGPDGTNGFPDGWRKSSGADVVEEGEVEKKKEEDGVVKEGGEEKDEEKNSTTPYFERLKQMALNSS